MRPITLKVDNYGPLNGKTVIMSLELCKYGNPVLRKKAVEVTSVTDEILGLADEMLETMHKERGVGLAAEQIGRSEAICVIDVPMEMDSDDRQVRENPDVKMPLVLINPKIVGRSEEIQTGQEGCLSFPDIYAFVDRAYEVDVEFMDREGVLRKVHAKGLLSRAIQHELDHLAGVLLVDRMSHVKKVALSGRLKRLSKKTKAAL